MKKLFGICLDNVSEDKLPEEEFLVKEYDDEKLLESLEEITIRYDQKSSKIRFGSMIKLLVISFITMALTLISFKIVEPLTEGENASPLPLLIPGILAFIGIMVIAYNRRRISTAVSSDEMRILVAEKDRELKKLYSSVGIPESALTLDILDYTYEIDKNGNEKLESYIATVSMWAYELDEKIYLSDEYSLYAFPKNAFKEIRYVEKSFTTYESSWNKPFSPASEEGDGYGLTLSNGAVYHKEYLAVILDNEGDEYELRMPAYEASAISRLTGLYPKR